MDIKQYIESGILESYVLGTASSQEIREVECISSIYPEIKTELTSIQEGMEKYVRSIAVTPPPEVKAKIMGALKNSPKLKITEPEQKNEAEIISLPKKQNFYKYGMAASILLLVGLFAYQNRLTNTNNTELAELRKELNSNADSNSKLQETIVEIQNREQLLASNSTSSFQLAGTPVSPDSKVRIFWRKTTSEIVIIQDELPKPTAETQYQLWGLVDGTPVSLGTLDKNSLISEVRKIDINKVDAFAITLEANGGAESPNLEQLYVIGNT